MQRLVQSSLVAVLVGLVVAVQGASPSAAAPPTVTSVSPPSEYNYKSTTITIGGSDFVATPTVTLGSIALTNVMFVSSTTLTATMPADLPAGVYALTVTNPDLQSGTLPSAFTVLSSADGSMGGWENLESMPVGHYRHAVVLADRRVYVIAGQSSPPTPFPKVNRVDRATVDLNGSITGWTQTSSLPIAKDSLGAAAWGDYVYAIGGDPGLTDVYFAHINPDGTLGAWTATTPITHGRLGHSVVAYNGSLYVIGGGIGFPEPVVERGVVNPDGSISSWADMASFPPQLRGFAAIVVRDSIYAFTTLGRVLRAHINADGTLGSWQTETSLSTGGGAFAAYDRGILYLNGGGGTSGFAVVRPDGSLTNWASTGSSDSLSSPAGFGLDGYMFSLGGITDGGGSITVGSVRRARLSPVTVTTLTPGALPTTATPTAITVNGSNFLPGATVQVGSGPVLTSQFTSTTAIQFTLPAGQSTGTYAITVTNGDGRVTTKPNALIIDNTAPTASIVINNDKAITSSASVTLTISASDDSSGVSEMAFSSDGGAFSAYEPFAPSKAYTLPNPDGPHTVSVRVRDFAGNVSAVASDSITLNRTGPSGFIQINKSAFTTTSPNVTLTIAVATATPESSMFQMSFSNDGVTYTAFETYAPTKAWTLSSGDGIKTVFGRFTDSSNNLSNVITDSISLETTIASDSLTINSAAIYTNTTSVNLTLGARAGSVEMMISNDGGFAGAVWEAYSAHKAWTITGTGSSPTPRVVYVRYRDAAGTMTPTVQDDIILDSSAPSGTAGISGGGSTATLLLTANDDLSGVDSMAVSATSSFAQVAWEAFATSKPWPQDGRGTFVKFRDRAGNVSPVQTPQGPAQPGAPFGLVESPANGANASGSLAITGWALDDTQVTRIRIYRDPVSGEPPNAQIFIGDAVQVDGARPDVQAAFSTLPFAERAGWGYLLLTNMLPNQGTGPITLSVYADDSTGQTTLLGTRTINTVNATATSPFGTIDTPAQGATANGNAYINFGWALTPQPKVIPTSGSTITVYVDGLPVGQPVYNNNRSDIAALFPGLANSNGAVGYFILDTTRYADGVHTIAWVVSDNAGAAAGIGSRYFRTRNYTTGLVAAPDVTTAIVPAHDTLIAESTQSREPVESRKAARVHARVGFDEEKAWSSVRPDAHGARIVRASSLERIQIRFNDGAFDRASLVVDGEERPVPIGSSFDRESGVFTWQPGPAFHGAYHLRFTGTANDGSHTAVSIVVVLDPR